MLGSLRILKILILFVNPSNAPYGHKYLHHGLSISSESISVIDKIIKDGNVTSSDQNVKSALYGSICSNNIYPERAVTKTTHIKTTYLIYLSTLSNFTGTKLLNLLLNILFPTFPIHSCIVPSGQTQLQKTGPNKTASANTIDINITDGHMYFLNKSSKCN